MATGYQIPANFGQYGNAGTLNLPGATGKESGMPWAAVAVPAAVSLASSLIGSSSSNKATKAQSKANSEALAFQKQQDMMDRAAWDKAMKAWEVNRSQLMQRYGIPTPPPAALPQAAPMQPGMVPGQPQGQPTGPGMPTPQPVGPYGIPPGGSMAEMIGRGGYTGAPQNRYGLR